MKRRTLDIDFPNHPHYQEQNPYTQHYGEAVRRLGWNPRDRDKDEETVLREAYGMLEQYTFEGCRDVFGLGAPFSLMKEMYCDVLACNAAVVARILIRREGDDAARRFLSGLYEKGRAAGFDRSHEFFPNRLDSRTFVPMRRAIDAPYLKAAGFEHLDNVLLCVGDCQTMQLAEWIRWMLPLEGLDLLAYQHSLRTFVSSGMGELIRPAGYLFFVNAGTQYGGTPPSEGQRGQLLDEMRGIVEWLAARPPRMCVFITNVFFAVDQSVRLGGVPREVAEDAVTGFGDEVAAILGQAPNARLVKLTDVCPLRYDNTPFRDAPTSRLIQHFHFPHMAALAERTAGVLGELTPFD